MALHTILSGSGAAGLHAAAAAEAALPEGTRLAWQVQIQPPRLPLLGTAIQVPTGGADAWAQAVAALLNWAHAHLPSLVGAHLWPGQPFATAAGGTVTVRWIKAQTVLSPLEAFISGAVPAGAIAALAGLDLPAVILASLAAGVVIMDLVGAWHVLAESPHTLTQIGEGLALSGVAILAVLVGVVVVVRQISAR